MIKIWNLSMLIFNTKVSGRNNKLLHGPGNWWHVLARKNCESKEYNMPQLYTH